MNEKVPDSSYVGTGIAVAAVYTGCSLLTNGLFLPSTGIPWLFLAKIASIHVVITRTLDLT